MIAQPENVPMTEISTVIFFILPMIVIIYQYIKMGIAIQQTTIDSFGKGSVHRKRKKSHQSNKSIVKMLCKYFIN
nr:unnamed protein product [Callosobruchus chinensis]